MLTSSSLEYGDTGSTDQLLPSLHTATYNGKSWCNLVGRNKAVSWLRLGSKATIAHFNTSQQHCKAVNRPGMFEGVGAIGLKWLQRVKEETGLMIATEVANSVHVGRIGQAA